MAPPAFCQEHGLHFAAFVIIRGKAFVFGCTKEARVVTPGFLAVMAIITVVALAVGYGLRHAS